MAKPSVQTFPDESSILPFLSEVLGAVAAAALVVLGIHRLRRSLGIRESPLLEELIPRTPREKRIFVILSIAAGIGEEVAFRGYALGTLAPFLGGAWGAAAFTAVVFGVLHAYQGPLGMARTAKELHELGLREIAKTDAEIAALGKKALGTADLASTIARLRTDRTVYFASGDEIVATAQRVLDRAKAAMGSMFGVLPEADCVISIVPDYEAPYTTIAYYRQPHYDGTKPGEYFVNVYQPETRPKFDFEALSWHEAIPGHHLQIAIAQELGALPAFRKFTGSTAYVEGWALYTERLADEMGLYSSDLDRVGMASYDAWRASRLVVDTGIHALGWTRAEAEAFMLEHTALSPQNISNEVDRYIGWPGQALAYKVGQLEILKLRAEAEAALGARFDLKGFHAAVLGAGAVTLPVLADIVHAWVTGRASGN